MNLSIMGFVYDEYNREGVLSYKDLRDVRSIKLLSLVLYCLGVSLCDRAKSKVENAEIVYVKILLTLLALKSQMCQKY